MLRSEITKVHHVKCMVCSFVKGKDGILGPKVDILENMKGKQGLFETCHTWARNKDNGMLIRSAIMERIKLLTLKRITSQLLNKFKEGLRRNRVESDNNLLQFYTYYNKANPCLSLRL